MSTKEASAYKNVTGGKLKLKGGAPPPVAGIKKKNKKKKEKEVTEVASKVLEEKQSTATSTTSTPQKTPAELKFEEAQRQREAERVKRMAKKSHRQRIEEFNKYLDGLSEHYDIPKVGPG